MIRAQPLLVKTPKEVCRELNDWMANKRVSGIIDQENGGLAIILEDQSIFRFEARTGINNQPVIVASRTTLTGGTSKIGAIP